MKTASSVRGLTISTERQVEKKATQALSELEKKSAWLMASGLREKKIGSALCTASLIRCASNIVLQDRFLAQVHQCANEFKQLFVRHRTGYRARNVPAGGTEISFLVLNRCGCHN